MKRVLMVCIHRFDEWREHPFMKMMVQGVDQVFLSGAQQQQQHACLPGLISI